MTTPIHRKLFSNDVFKIAVTTMGKLASETLENNNLNIEEVLVTNHKQQASLFTKIAPNFFGQIATFRIR